MYNILICDDDRDIVEALKIYLSVEGYCIFTAYDGREALERMQNNEIHLALLDIMMPRLDGIAVTAKLRESGNIPIIILSAKGEDADKVIGLNVGADDYITKPFNPAEVQARVRSQLRRYVKLGGMDKTPDRYCCGGLLLDDAAKSVSVDGRPVTLTPIEYNILHLLMVNQGRVFSSSQIYELVWNADALGSDSSVAVHIRHLREKIEINPSDPTYIKVVWGLGYKLEKELRNEKF